MELKLSPNRKKLKFYDELLSKYKLESVKNFWYKDFKKISIDELVDEAKKYSSRIIGKPKNEKQQLRFKITDRIEGIVMLSLQSHGSSYILQNLSYGFISEYRDYGAGYINISPFDQNHFQEYFVDGYSLFEREWEKIFDYFNFVKGLEGSLLTIDNEQPTKNKFFGEFNQKIGFNEELWFILSLINVQKANGEFDKMIRAAEEGLRLQDPKKAGSGWIKYYEEKIKTGSNNVYKK